MNAFIHHTYMHGWMHVCMYMHPCIHTYIGEFITCNMNQSGKACNRGGGSR